MDKKLSHFQNSIRNIAEDKTSGATEMLLNLLETLNEALKHGYTPSSFRTELEVLLHKQHLFTNLTNIARMLLNAANNPSETARIIASVQQYYQNLYHRQALRIKEHCPHQPVSILTHSNSAAVKNVVSHLQKHLKIRQIYQTLSAPGEEGRIQAGFWASKGLKTFLITDAAVAKFIAQADCIILGSDQYNNEVFVNKTGSLNISIIANYYSKTVFVLSDRYKYEKKIPPLTEFQLLPEGIYRPSHILEAVPLSLCHLLI